VITNASRATRQAGIQDGSIVECDGKLAALFAFGVINGIGLYRPGGLGQPEEIIQSF